MQYNMQQPIRIAVTNSNSRSTITLHITKEMIDIMDLLFEKYLTRYVIAQFPSTLNNARLVNHFKNKVTGPINIEKLLNYSMGKVSKNCLTIFDLLFLGAIQEVCRDFWGIPENKK